MRLKTSRHSSSAPASRQARAWATAAPPCCVSRRRSQVLAVDNNLSSARRLPRCARSGGDACIEADVCKEAALAAMAEAARRAGPHRYPAL